MASGIILFFLDSGSLLRYAEVIAPCRWDRGRFDAVERFVLDVERDECDLAELARVADRFYHHGTVVILLLSSLDNAFTKTEVCGSYTANLR